MPYNSRARKQAPSEQYNVLANEADTELKERQTRERQDRQQPKK